MASRCLPVLVWSLAAIACSAQAAAPPRPATGAAAPTPGAATLSWQACRLEHASRLVSIEAQCATLRVPEDDSRPAGRQIDLFIARVPAVSGRKAPDPLLLIAGGPGMGASEMYPGVAQAFARTRRTRDIIVVDQRGTGRSNALRCDHDSAADADANADTAAFLAATRRCFEALAARADLRQYTTTVAVRDLERVRAALSVAQWNLYGVSYGSRVAQHYLRRHPDRARSVILDGVVPPGLALGPDIALDAQAAFERILARCARDPDCNQRFGDTRAHYQSLMARLRSAKQPVTIPDPTTAAPRRIEFGPAHLGVVLRLQSYSAATASLLPLALHEAATRDNLVPLAGLFAMSLRGIGDAMAAGMHNSVVCSEDLPFVDFARLDRARLAATYLGTEQVDALRDVCSYWPRGPLDPDFRAPLRSDVPVLLLSGGDDPVTPPAYAERAMQGLSRSRHLLLPSQGHGQIGATCMDRVVARFLQDLDPKGLDARCLSSVRPAPFFTTLSGAAP
jgi:pimeloyl-ACP methyl ester carboxylesterase